MQENVNAVNVLNELVINFGNDNVQTCGGGIIKLSAKELRNGDLLTISNLLQWSNIQVKRSGLGLLILFIPKPWAGEYSPEILFHLSQIELIENGANPVSIETTKVGSKQDDFKIAALPMMNYLSENHHPHVYATVDATEAMLIEGLKTVNKD